MLALIDADTLCYASAAMAEQENEGLAKSNVDNGLDGLLRRLAEDEFELWVTGDTNFRHQIYPEYKANRLKTPRPRFLQACKKHLVENYGANVSEGCEADDMLGIEQTRLNALGVDTLISSIDKDLDMIPGWHYSPEITRLGKTVKEERRYVVSPKEAITFFYTQLLTGDPTDNIKGVKGIGKVGAIRLLAMGQDESSLFECVREAYGCDEELELNARCLWIWRKRQDNIVERWEELFGYQREE